MNNKNEKPPRLETKARAAMKKYDMAPTFALVGFSGGADSTALMCFLTEALKTVRVAAVHVNHGLRGADADADEEYCRSFCERRGIEFYTVHIDVLSACHGVAVEETARKMRYASLIEKAKELGADAIALAHTAGDSAETALFNMSRGCGISGLGIPPVREEDGIKIIRPLIQATRNEILEYLAAKGVSFVTDKTNYDEKYTRNFIRQSVVPSLEKVNAQAIKNISALSDRARVDEEFIDGFAREYVLRSNALVINNLRALHPSVLCRVIMKAARAAGAGTLSFVHIEAVEKLIASGQSGDTCDLPGDAKALIADGKLKFLHGGAKAPAKTEDYSIDVGGGIEERELGFAVSFEKPPQKDGVRVYRAILPKEIAGGLVARKRRAGDCYRFGNMTRNIKKLTTKVPFDARGRRPVFAYDGAVVWYPGFPVSDAFKGGDTEIYYTEIIL